MTLIEIKHLDELSKLHDEQYCFSCSPHIDVLGQLHIEEVERNNE
jgi:hypothetical protein